jgi:flagellar protein FlaI
MNMKKKRSPQKKKGEHPLDHPEKVRNILAIPKFEKISDVNIQYPLIEPYAYAEIKWVEKDKKLFYRLIEPDITEEEKTTLNTISKSLEEIIDVKLSTAVKRESIINYLKEKINIIIEDLGLVVSEKVYIKIMYYMMRDFAGFNEIEPLMHDPYIEDIGCNGLNTPIYIIHKKFGSVVTNITYTDNDTLTNFVVKISERCGRYISYAQPLLDGTLPDGSRVQASIAKDVTTRGPTFSIRKFRANPFSPVDLVKLGTVSVNMMAYLWLIIQYNASILICGGVSSGKTTMLNAVSMFIRPEDKVISIEDTREINLPHENWIPAVARKGFGVPGAGKKKYGEVELFDLLKESFRQNPSYVVVGEVRGKEAYVMFQGIASGHPSLGTIHAGSVDDLMKRLETPPIELSSSLIDSLDTVIIMVNSKEGGKSKRRIKEIVEIQNVDARTGIAHTKKIYSWIPYSDDFTETLLESELLRRISFQEGVSQDKIKDEIDKRRAVLDWAVKHNVIEYEDFCRLITLYYNDNEYLMRMVRENRDPFTIKPSSLVVKKSRKTVKKPKKGKS